MLAEVVSGDVFGLDQNILLCNKYKARLKIIASVDVQYVCCQRFSTICFQSLVCRNHRGNHVEDLSKEIATSIE